MTKAVGKPIPRFEGKGHVTGTTRFVDDVNLPGMLCVKVLHSPVHKGTIRKLDVSAAEKMPGVAGVLTSKNLPGSKSYMVDEQQVLVEKNIRYRGERIAVVAAVDEETALEAIGKIVLEIEEQTPVFDPLEAMKPDAPKVRPEGNFWEFNSGKSRVVRKGDVDKGFAEADEIIEQTYINKMNDHAAMEPYASVAYIDEYDRLTIHTMSQARHYHLGALCPVFNLGRNKIKLVGGTVGGGFGGKAEVVVDHIAGLMALMTRKPVKYRMTRKEDLLFSYKRGAFTFEYKSGVTKDGRVTAHKIKAIHDIGAYQTFGAYAIEKQCLYIAGPYTVPNIWYDGYSIYTNKPVASAMRGFSIINTSYAAEMQMNLMAEAIGMDPWEIRFINAWRDGDTGPTRWEVVAAGVIETMKKAAELDGIELPAHLMAMSSRGR